LFWALDSLIRVSYTPTTVSTGGVASTFYWRYDIISSQSSILSSQCVIEYDGIYYWIGVDRFLLYNGTVKEIPNSMNQNYFFDNLNYAQSQKVWATKVPRFGEVWWFYPSANSNENDSYVAWDYVENHWTIGTLARTCGTDRSVFRNPIMVGTNGYIYDHEVGLNYDSSLPYAESGPVQIGNGDNIMYVNELIPDERNQGGVVATFKTRYYPNAEETSYGPYTLANPTSVRFNGRQVKMRVTTTSPPTDWRVGTQRLNAIAGGRR
jgi:hypothetical protein